MTDQNCEQVILESWGDVRLTGIAWIEAGRDVALSWSLHGNRNGVLTCTCVHSLNMNIITPERHGGFPLTWTADFKNNEGDGWKVLFDFASAGVIEFTCMDMSLAVSING
ncbi:MAG: hypothetical protein ACI93R_003844 [Flavobacteriales bacterium]|jgi:hypothetical protein